MVALIAAAAIQCQARSIGPGSLQRGGTAGAACMLAAFKECRAAGYELSSFGVDTVHTETFRIVGCTVSITESFRVVPQQPRVTARRTCKRLRKTTTGDIVADRCTPRSTTSLTKLGT